MEEAKTVFREYLSNNKLRKTVQREKIIELFLATEHHLSAEELYRIVKEKYPSIGWATVYRTLKHLCEAGIATQVEFGDGITRYEHKYGHPHHDHLVCVRCGKLIETTNQEIEKLQEEIAKKHKFKTLHHRLEIFGFCYDCQKK